MIKKILVLILSTVLFSGCFTTETGPIYKPATNKVEAGSAKIGPTGGLFLFPFSSVLKQKKFGRDSITSRNYQVGPIHQDYVSVNTDSLNVLVIPVVSSKTYDSYFSFKMKDPDQEMWKGSCRETMITGNKTLGSKERPPYQELGLSCTFKSKKKGKWKLRLDGEDPYNVSGPLKTPDKVNWEVTPIIQGSLKGPAGYVFRKGNLTGGKVQVTGNGMAWLTSNKKDQPGFFAASIALYLRQLAY